MTTQAQLVSPQQFPLEMPLRPMDSGMLGNVGLQLPASHENPSPNFGAPAGGIYPFPASYKLALLKRQKFTTLGRDQRVAASLAALNSPQPTELPLEQWKEIAEEIGDEDWLDE